MGDSIIWYPRAGSSGDDRYKFQSTVDVSNPLSLLAGDSDDYSNPPTQVQVNDGSSVNQIIAEIRKRYHQYYNSTTTNPAYKTQTTKILAAHLTSNIWHGLRSCINQLREFEDIFNDGSISYTWTDTLDTGSIIKHIHWWELRKAIALSTQGYPLKIISNNGYRRRRTFRTDGSLASDSELISGYDNRVGHLWTYRSTDVDRQHDEYRWLISVKVPDGLENVVNATLWVAISEVETFNTWNMQLYASDTDDSSPVAADAHNLDNSCGSIGSTSLTIGTTKANIQANAFTIPASVINARSGSNLSLILKSSLDILSPPGRQGVNTQYDHALGQGTTVPYFDVMINW